MLCTRNVYRNFTVNLHCWSQLKNVDSIWTCTFGIPVCRSTRWAIEPTGIRGEFLSNLSARDILATLCRLIVKFRFIIPWGWFWNRNMYSTHAFRFHFYGLTLVKTREFFFSNSVNRCTGNYFSNRTIVIARQKFSLHGVSLRMWHRLKLSGERNSRKNVYCHIFSFNLKYSLLSGRFFYVRSLAN